MPRTAAAQVGTIKEATGSARFESGQTIVLASVYGPSQPRYSRHEEYDRATLDVTFNLAAMPNVTNAGWGGLEEDGADDDSGDLGVGVGNAAGIVGSMVASTTSAELVRREREGVRILTQALLPCIDVKACPRTLIVIKVCVLRNDGAAMSAAINACSLALLNAGIPLLYFPMALTYSVLDPGTGAGVLDPTAEHEARAASTFVFTLRHMHTAPGAASDQHGLSVVQVHATGVFAVEHIEVVSREALAAGPKLSRFFRSAVKTA